VARHHLRAFNRYIRIVFGQVDYQFALAAKAILQRRQRPIIEQVAVVDDQDAPAELFHIGEIVGG